MNDVSKMAVNNKADALILGDTLKGLSAKQMTVALSTQKLSVAQAALALKQAGVDETGRRQILTNMGLVASKKSVTTATVALKAAVKGLGLLMAKNPILVLAMTLPFAIKGINYLTQSKQRAVEKAQELTQAWEDQRKTLQQTGATIESVSSDYERLARGVDNQGRNISLSTEEYKHYNDIVNQIADMFPHMISGFTNEGNAILTHKGNVEELTKAYSEMKQAAQNAIIVGARSAWGGFEAATTKADYSGFMWHKERASLEEQERFLNRLVNDRIVDSSFSRERMQTLMRDVGIDFWKNASTDSYRNLLLDDSSQRSLVSYHRQVVSQLNAETAKVKPILTAFLEDDWDFQRLDGDIQTAIGQITNSFGFSFFNQFDNENLMYAWVRENFIEPLKNPETSEEIKSALRVLLNPDIKDLPASEYAREIQDAISSLPAKLQNELSKEIKIKLGIDVNENHINIMLANVRSKLQEEHKQFADTLSLDDLTIYYNLDNYGPMTWEGLQAAAKYTAKVFEATSRSAKDLADSIQNVGKLRSSLENAEQDIAAGGSPVSRLASTANGQPFALFAIFASRLKCKKCLLGRCPRPLKNERRPRTWKHKHPHKKLPRAANGIVP